MQYLRKENAVDLAVTHISITTYESSPSMKQVELKAIDKVNSMGFLFSSESDTRGHNPPPRGKYEEGQTLQRAVLEKFVRGRAKTLWNK